MNIVKDVPSNAISLPQYLIPPSHHLQQSNHLEEQRHYPQGPQGAPFAPQPPPIFLPIEQEPSRTTPKPVKKRRRLKPEEECGFCQGDGVKGENGEPEPLMTCSECARSGASSQFFSSYFL